MLPAATVAVAGATVPQAVVASVGAMTRGGAAGPGALAGWLVATWAAGAAGLALSMLRSQRRFRAALGELQAHPDGSWRSRSARIGPAVIGAWRGRVVLPADFDARYDAVQRELVLRHERVHVARFDLAANLFAAALRCLHWFNPLQHYAVARFRFDQELAADAVVLAQAPQARRDYADAMLKTQLLDDPPPLGCHWQPAHPLKERILMLKQPPPGAARAAFGATLALALSLGTGYVAWASQPPRAAAGSVAAVPVTDNSGKVTYARLVPPAYPADAVAEKAHGTVMLRVLVDVDGSPKTVEIDASSGDARLDEAAAAKVRSDWHFNPLTTDGKPAQQWVQVPITFSLDGPPADSLAPAGNRLDEIYIAPRQ
jgi:TonB family protein